MAITHGKDEIKKIYVVGTGANVLYITITVKA